MRLTLTASAFSKVQAHIETEIAGRAAEWNSHGWAVVGTRRSLRVEVAVAQRLVTPRNPITPILLPSGEVLKPSVRASGFGMSRPLEATLPIIAPPQADAETAIDLPLAPGSCIFVDSSVTQRAGVACFVTADEKIYLVTCGHVFEKGASETGVFVRHKKVAKLAKNFLEESPQLDAAYCEVLPDGKRMLDQSSSAKTWFTDVLAPVAGQGKAGTFWPTNEWASDAITTTIDSYSASDSQLFNDFWPHLNLAGLIRTQKITTPGDSGSLLSIEGHYYGSCTGSPSWSYFTPLSATLARMRQFFTEVELWQPDT